MYKIARGPDGAVTAAIPIDATGLPLAPVALYDPAFLAWWNVQDPATRDDLQPHAPIAQAYPLNVQAAITDFKNYLGLTPTQSQALLGISAKQDQFNRDVIAALAFLNSQLSGS